MHSTFRNEASLAVDSKNILRGLSPEDLQALGVGHLAYVKPIRLQDKTAYALHAADGTALTLTDSTESAWALALQNDLDLVILQ